MLASFTEERFKKYIDKGATIIQERERLNLLFQRTIEKYQHLI